MTAATAWRLPDTATAPETELARRLERITALLEPDWRPGEWFPDQERIVFNPDHPLVSLVWCRREGCDLTTSWKIRLCGWCRKQWRQAGEPDLDEWCATERATRPRKRPKLCSVEADGQHCPRSTRTKSGLCDAHADQFRKAGARGVTIDEFMATAEPMSSMGICDAVVCDEPVNTKSLCAGHYGRWAQAGRPEGDARAEWLATVPPNERHQELSLRGLQPLTKAEVLYALQQRDREGIKTQPSVMSTIVNHLRRRQAVSLLDVDPKAPYATDNTLAAIQDRVRLAHSDPDSERDKDVWDARVFGHPAHRTWNFTGISQDWLRQAVKDYAYVAQTRRSAAHVQAQLRAVTLLSEQLARRPDRGDDRSVVGRRDVEGFAVALNRKVQHGEMTNKTRCGLLQHARAVLADARPMGLLDGVPTTFAITRDLIPPERPAVEPPGKALPDGVVDQLSRPEALDVLRRLGAQGTRDGGALSEFEGESWVVLFETLRDTGRRPGEITTLRVDDVTRDRDGAPLLVYTNHKAGAEGRQLPISEALHARLVAQRQAVLAVFPATPRDQLLLFPRTTRNQGGTIPRRSDWVGKRIRQWVDALDRLDGPDLDADGQPVPFDRDLVFPYAFRHTYAQRHADAGTPVDVLRALMDHTEIQTTQVYYRVTATRKRDATDRLDEMRRNAQGDQLDRGRLSRAARLRDAVGHVAVPFGVCGEPTNVQAGGQHCPIRYRCMGCGYFSSDPSFLPDLKAHLDELVRARERGIALGAEAWALVPNEEIERLRTLIARLETDLDQLPDDQRELIDRSCADLRTARGTVPVAIGRRIP